MSDYPTAEEEFEMQYGDELQMMDDDDLIEIDRTTLPYQTPVPSSTQQQQNTNLAASNSFSLSQGSELSQIPHDSGSVNRRLFGAAVTGRAASTPFQRKQTENLNRIDPLNEIQNLGLNTRKRRLANLFGDIQDIDDENDFYDLENVYKKVKTEEERDMEIIDQILQARKKCHTNIHPLKQINIRRLEALNDFKMRNLSYAVPKWPFTTVTRSDRERIYVRFHSEEFETDRINEINCMNKEFNGLLGEAKDTVWADAREIMYKRLTASTEIIQPPAEVFCDEDKKLWVEKYRPLKYIDLLSDESTNRGLLQWLKLWDKCVFGRDNRKIKETHTIPAQLNSFNKRTGRFEQNGGWRRKTKSSLNTDLDETGRPMQKIALLCGAPGLGKTTLAHTIARHAGYVVREVNASDDRSPEAFRLALENNTQMKALLNKDNRPNCIILDEIDGAPIQSIEFLLRFISGNMSQGKGKNKSGKDKKVILKTPIICICNDMYVPALRQLRQVAFIVNFPKTESARLAERLLDIARAENIKTDLTSLLALAEKTGNDVRSCLGMLQFYSGLKKPLKLHDVLRSNIGQKDRQKGLFSIWTSIFQIQRPRKTINEEDEKQSSELVTMSDMSYKTRMENILNVVHMGGDYERLMQGVFENYLSQKMPDPDLNGIAEATNWFCFNDLLQTHINHTQNYSTYPYLQYGFVSWHYLFASMAWPKIHFPNKGYEVFQKTQISKMIFSSLRKNLTVATKGIGEGHAILLDAIPLIKHVLCPSLRSVSLQLLSPKERQDLHHAVEIMSDLGLTYTQVRAPDGTYLYQIEPDIESLVHFNGCSTQNLSYWAKQIIAREVELEKMRRAQPKLMKVSQNPITTEKRAAETQPKKKTSPTAIPNHLRKLMPKVIKERNKEVTTKDFFGRISTRTTTLSVQEGGSDVIVKSPIWYRYKEGFNNAVRKDVTLSDLV